MLTSNKGCNSLCIPIQKRKVVIWSTVVTIILLLAPLNAAIIDVTTYGANGNDTNDDTTAIQNAIAALSNGDTLLFPFCSNHYLYRLDYSLAGSDYNLAITEDRITIIIQGRIKASGTPLNYNQILYINGAEDLTIIGQGNEAIMQGSGDFNYYPSGYDGPMLIKSIGVQRLTVKNLTLLNGPSTSMLLRGCTETHITDCLFKGGPSEMIETNVHGILYTGEQDLLIEDNVFKPNETGGKAYSWICSGSTSSSFHVSIINNQFESSFDHSLYTFGLFNSVIANNIVNDCDD